MSCSKGSKRVSAGKTPAENDALFPPREVKKFLDRYRPVVCKCCNSIIAYQEVKTGYTKCNTAVLPCNSKIGLSICDEVMERTISAMSKLLTEGPDEPERRPSTPLPNQRPPCFIRRHPPPPQMLKRYHLGEEDA